MNGSDKTAHDTFLKKKRKNFTNYLEAVNDLNYNFKNIVYTLKINIITVVNSSSVQ